MKLVLALAVLVCHAVAMDDSLRQQAQRALQVALNFAERSLEHLIPLPGQSLQVPPPAPMVTVPAPSAPVGAGMVHGHPMTCPVPRSGRPMSGNRGPPSGIGSMDGPIPSTRPVVLSSSTTPQPPMRMTPPSRPRHSGASGGGFQGHRVLESLHALRSCHPINGFAQGAKGVRASGMSSSAPL